MCSLAFQCTYWFYVLNTCSTTLFPNDVVFLVIDVLQTKVLVEYNTGLLEVEFNTLNMYMGSLLEQNQRYFLLFSSKLEHFFAVDITSSLSFKHAYYSRRVVFRLLEKKYKSLVSTSINVLY